MVIIIISLWILFEPSLCVPFWKREQMESNINTKQKTEHILYILIIFSWKKSHLFYV